MASLLLVEFSSFNELDAAFDLNLLVEGFRNDDEDGFVLLSILNAPFFGSSLLLALYSSANLALSAFILLLISLSRFCSSVFKLLASLDK